MGDAAIVEEDAEGLKTNGFLSDVLMAIEFRSASGFGVVAVNHSNVIQANRRVEMEKRLRDAFWRDDVIACNVSVEGVDAGSNGDDAAQAADDFGDLLEAASQRKLGARGVFNQDGEGAFREVEILGHGGDGSGSLQQAGFAIGSAE